MKLTAIIVAAVLAQTGTLAKAATVSSTASYQLLSFSTSPWASDSWLVPDPFETRTEVGTGSASTDAMPKAVSANAATSGRSMLEMDHGSGQIISRDRLSITNTGTYMANFGGHVLPHLTVSILGNNDGELAPNGLFGELASAVSALNIYATIFHVDGSESMTTYYNSSLELGFGETGSKSGTGGGANGFSFVAGLNPGERAELVFEMSAISNAWHSDPEALEQPSTVPLPAGFILLPGALGMLFGVRKRSDRRRRRKGSRCSIENGLPPRTQLDRRGPDHVRPYPCFTEK
ncbi:hypothetical protein [Albibacillus kandeliae]|uniref:hypothetical protein n=1 Tax=Albibacillus kandeliae TaxID=2174228 RepID=UPI000D698069|nr:hypothetical protein [Albibacillus kandeliae]